MTLSLGTATVLHLLLFVGMKQFCLTNGATVESRVPDPSICYETCTNSTFASTEDVGRCIQRPVNEAGMGNEIAQKMMAIHTAAVAADVRAGTGGNATLLAGMNAAAPGATSPHPEGLSFCATDRAGADTDAFYWVPNCDLAPVFCRNMTREEVDMKGTVAYIVDAGLHDDDEFHRYVFTTTEFFETAYQSPTLSTGFRCSKLPWFRNSGYCTEPLATTCPTTSTSSSDRNAYQIYGDPETVVVGQTLREMHLSPCLGENENLDELKEEEEESSDNFDETKEEEKENSDSFDETKKKEEDSSEISSIAGDASISSGASSMAKESFEYHKGAMIIGIIVGITHLIL
eukprot:CAMPEP_0113307794 /NCGR_PEP_ID=MMETSP0010_2-20120614/6496_1 /TAXON_ID=216773 ORGANISM="Corethron hystrix, Strain 308" /NCGR_SAMPLE_ID=MMETSP0010_2 /ASSEMBLY_ACC=CAM_ASM_000155 /LENGTH=344 /DNA_ID=CAMNT_0000162719 /DNA_START=85 /DNA_END=1119 /DNA_ORIENTATION=+ /assembly_acc=CAM_ASM_000155